MMKMLFFKWKQSDHQSEQVFKKGIYIFSWQNDYVLQSTNNEVFTVLSKVCYKHLCVEKERKMTLRRRPGGVGGAPHIILPLILSKRNDLPAYTQKSDTEILNDFWLPGIGTILRRREARLSRDRGRNFSGPGFGPEKFTRESPWQTQSVAASVASSVYAYF